MIDKAKEWMKANMGKFAITEGVERNWFSIHTSNMAELLAAYESPRVQELEEARESDNRNWESVYRRQQDRILELEAALRELESAVSVVVNENDYGRTAINRLVEARTNAERALAGKKEVGK